MKRWLKSSLVYGLTGIFATTAAVNLSCGRSARQKQIDSLQKEIAFKNETLNSINNSIDSLNSWYSTKRDSIENATNVETERLWKAIKSYAYGPSYESWLADSLYQELDNLTKMKTSIYRISESYNSFYWMKQDRLSEERRSVWNDLEKTNARLDSLYDILRK